MSNKNDIFNEESLEKEAPLLASIPKRNPYTVPEGYFDELPSAIMEKCRQSTAAPERANKIFWLFRPQWMMAVFVGVVGLAFLLRHDTPQTYEALASKISDSAIYQNLQNNIDYVDVNSLEEAVQNDNTFTPPPVQSDSTGNQEDIVKYLMNHNVDASDIEDEL
jgi:hypothetical protein